MYGKASSSAILPGMPWSFPSRPDAPPEVHNLQIDRQVMLLADLAYARICLTMRVSSVIWSE